MPSRRSLAAPPAPPSSPTGPRRPTRKTSVKEAVCWISPRRERGVVLFTFSTEAQFSPAHISAYNVLIASSRDVQVIGLIVQFFG